MTVPTSPGAATSEEEIKALALAVQRKIALITAGILSLALGVVFTALFLADAEALLRLLHLGGLLEGIQGWVQANVRGRDGAAVDAVLVARLLLASLLNFVVFLLALVGAMFAGRAAGRREGRHEPAPGSFASACLEISRGPASSGALQVTAGVLLVLVSVVLVISYGAFPFSLALFPLVLGLAQGFVALGLATRTQLGVLLDEATELEVPAPPPPPKPGQARATGLELLGRLRSSPVYRRQVVVDRPMPGFAFQEAGQGLETIASRFPRLVPLLEKQGISRLTVQQHDALARILAVDPSSTLPRDFALVGAAGTGRSTLANILSLGTVLNREGAVYCLTPESPGRNVDGAGFVRHPGVQVRDWIQQAGLGEYVRVAESYADQPASLDLGAHPDLVFTDIRRLSSALLQELHGNEKDGAREFLRRLRYVIIDHPHRLSREDMMRLRIALTRLRLTAEQLGANPTFLVLLPQLNNAIELTKYLVNNFHVEQLTFSTWTASTHLVGWVPPLEVLDRHEDDEPLLVRSPFFPEIEALLCEIGYQSNQLTDPLRVAIVDSRPLLGPEARMHLRDKVGEFLAREAGEGKLVQVRHQWSYFGTPDLAIDRRHDFDLVLALGLGPHPGLLVSSLRAAIADKGALVLVGDSSPADLESLEQITSPGWEPPGQQDAPGYSIPDMSEAIVAHELACLLEDFRELQQRSGSEDTPFAILVERLYELFPGEHTRRLLDSWRAEGYLEDLGLFEFVRGQKLPRERAAIRCTATELRGSQYEVPWGCSTRSVYRVWDRAANDVRAVGAFLNDYVDDHRLFIDFHPYAFLRHAPNTVYVTGLVRRQLNRADQETMLRRYVEQGDIEVATPDHRDCLRLDRRAPRLDCELLEERPAQAERGWARANGGASPSLLNPLSAVLKVHASSEPSPARGAELTLLRKAALVDAAHQQTVRSGGASGPTLQALSGVWNCTVNERLRDVVTTGERLIEEPVLVTSLVPPGDLRLERRFEAQALNLFLRRLPARRQGASRRIVILLDSSVATGTPPTLPPGEAPWSMAHALSQALGQARTLLRELAPHEDLKVGLWLAGSVQELRPFKPDTKELAPEQAWTRLEELFLAEPGLFTTEALDADGSVLEVLRRVLDLGEDFDASQDLEPTPLPPWVLLVRATSDSADPTPTRAWLEKQGAEGRLVLTPWTLYASGRQRKLELEGLETAIQATLEGSGLPADEDLRVAQRSRAAHQALAFLLSRYLQARYLNFETEFRVATVPCEGPKGERSAHFTSYRLLVHRLHANEFSFSQSSLLQQVLEPAFLTRFLNWAWERLENCACKDGCSACCVGLGKIPALLLPAEGFREEDAISRKGAYVLVGALLGRKLDWTRFKAGGEDEEEPPKPLPEGGDELARALAEIVGTAQGQYRDGEWHKLFRGFMDLDGAWLAAASWEDPWSMEECYIGYYDPNSNRVRVKKGVGGPGLRLILLHEFVHNWQHRGGRFNKEHHTGTEALQYFPSGGGTSKLVIEGHARWSENQRLVQVDGRPVHRPSSPDEWNEYKTGFFLMEGIEKAVGEEGLKAWLCRPECYDWNAIRSRDPGLRWPFTLTQALRHLGLEQAARTGTPPHDDVLRKLDQAQDADPGAAAPAPEQEAQPAAT